MAKPPPSLEQIAAQLRAFSSAKGRPITGREWRAHPQRLCGSTTVRRLFQRPWNEILRTSGITPRDTTSPEYVADWILAFYAHWQRWPKGRDFKRPCSYSVVSQVFRDHDNSVAAAVQLAQDKLKMLTVDGIVLSEYLAGYFITVTPQALPATNTLPTSALLYGAPTGYAPFPHAPRCVEEVVAWFVHLVTLGKLWPRLILESINLNRFPNCKAKRYVPGRKGYTDVSIELEVRSADYLAHRHTERTEPCDSIVCWEDNWPADVPRPSPQIVDLRTLIGAGRR